MRYCSLVMSREVFCVSEGHRKPETYRANLCDQHKFCASRSVLLRTEWTGTILQKQRRGKICSAVFMNLCYNSVKENISEYYSAADMEIIQRNVNVF